MNEWTCSDCGPTTRPHHGNGLCRACYMRQYRKLQKARREEKLDAAWESGVTAAVETVGSMLKNGTCVYDGDRITLNLMGTAYQRRIFR